MSRARGRFGELHANPAVAASCPAVPTGHRTAAFQPPSGARGALETDHDSDPDPPLARPDHHINRTMDIRVFRHGVCPLRQDTTPGHPGSRDHGMLRCEANQVSPIPRLVRRLSNSLSMRAMAFQPSPISVGATIAGFGVLLVNHARRQDIPQTRTAAMTTHR